MHGPVHVEGWSSGGHLYARVRDEAVGIVPRPDTPGLGMGLPLMAQMAEDLHVADREDAPGTTVLLKFTLSESRAGSD